MQHRRSPIRAGARASAFALAFAAATLGATRDARAEQRSLNYLTTGNGHGFQVFDTNKQKITQFLEHPYRYIGPQPNAPPPDQPQGDGIGRRNLAFDMFFGLRGSGGSGWLSQPQSAGTPEYVDQSNIIRVPAQLAGVNAESYFFAPFGLERNVMVGLLHAPGAEDGAALFNFHMGGGRPDPDANGESTRASTTPGAVIETGPGGGAMIYVALSQLDHADCQGPFDKIGGGLGDDPGCSQNDIAVGFQGKLANGWMAVAVGYVDDPGTADDAAAAIKAWGAGRTPDKILSDTKAEFEAWRKPPPEGTALCSDDEKKLWRQSETVLRMGQIREPNTASRHNNGMVLASLPPGEWHSGWVRDAQYAIVALARMGHHEEAKMALDFLLNAAPVGKYKKYVRNQDYVVSVVRYFGTGEEEADYSGQQTPNVETDGWGMVLWTARQYLDASGDTAWLSSPARGSSTVYDVIVNGIAAPLEAQLETNGIMAADSSIWEVHDQNKRHYAYTSMAAARGFCDMAQIATKGGHAGDAPKYQGLSKRVKDGFLASFVDPQGALAGSIEGLGTGKYYDGAVAEAFTWNILPDFKNDTAKATLDVLAHLRVDSGGYKRNNDGLSSYDNNEWILVDMRIANALRRAGRGAEADGVVATIVQKAAANFYLLPELFNDTPTDGQIGVYAGSIPMVGYGGGAYVLTMLDRSGLIEPNDCGDGKGVTLPKVDCSGVSTTPGNVGPGGGDGGVGNNADGVPDASQLPFVPACLCDLVGGDRGLGPYGLAMFLAAPALLLARRARRRKNG